MYFIEHIIEPNKLLLVWQSLNEAHRTRYIVGELNRVNEKVFLRYLTETADFDNAQKQGFVGYPAFQDTSKIYENVLDAFMHRLPPRKRGDFSQYLESLRIKSNADLSDFALLGYSGARLPSDGFSIVHPFDKVDDPCELILEAAGFRYINEHAEYESIKIGTQVDFSKGQCTSSQEEAIEIMANKKLIGYVNRGLISTFNDWLDNARIAEAWIEKKNGSPSKPAIYIYVKIAAK